MDTNQVSAIASHLSVDATHLNTIVVAVIGFLGIVVTTIGTVILGRMNVNSRITKQMASGNSDKIDSLMKTTSQIHAMVNKPFGVALETAATAMETVARMTREPDHIYAAKIARSLSNEHNSAMEEYDMAQKVAAALNKPNPDTPEVKS